MSSSILSLLRASVGGLGSRVAAAFRPEPKLIGPYRVYTRLNDEIVKGGELEFPLGALAPEAVISYKKRIADYETSIASRKSEVSRSISEALQNVRLSRSPGELHNLRVIVLADQSGSLEKNGLTIPLACACAVADEFLSSAGATFEILGFTTSSWYGGRARVKWMMSGGRPTSPGRLCDLLHIIYRAATDPSDGDPAARYRAMLRPGLLKENVDGEALEWASERLSAMGGQRKILVVISDGAPVDDSTLSENEAGILHRHIQEVSATLRETTDIELLGIGLEHDTSLYYKNAVTVSPAWELPVLISQILADAIAYAPVAIETEQSLDLDPQLRP